MNKHKKRLLAELKDKEYRDAYVSSSVDVGIAFQIRALRERVPWTQAELAEKVNMQQERISVLENPSRSPTTATLKRLANAFDVGLIIRFVPFSELVDWEINLSPKSLEVLSFDEESSFQDMGADQGSSTAKTSDIVNQERSITDSAGAVVPEEVLGVPFAYIFRGDMVSDATGIVQVPIP
jgi:transcriptional regulator with XRE-family HTH domain